MAELQRVGVSLEKSLLSAFDELIARRGYESRSEAIRDLIRNHLSVEQLSNPKVKAVAVLCMVYDHHRTRLMQKLTDLQHSHLLNTICSMHIHLDQDQCMEIVVLNGRVGDINKMADVLLSQKGVKLGKLHVLAPEGGYSSAGKTNHHHH